MLSRLSNPSWSTGTLAIIAVAAAIALAATFYSALRARQSPERRERQRRLNVNQFGRMTDGFVIDADPDTFTYTYSVRGVDYHTAQDITALRHYLPDEPRRLLGPVGVKYLVNRPENSIILSENWCGLKMKSPDGVIYE